MPFCVYIVVCVDVIARPVGFLRRRREFCSCKSPAYKFLGNCTHMNTEKINIKAETNDLEENKFPFWGSSMVAYSSVPILLLFGIFVLKLPNKQEIFVRASLMMWMFDDVCMHTSQKHFIMENYVVLCVWYVYAYLYLHAVLCGIGAFWRCNVHHSTI